MARRATKGECGGTATPVAMCLRRVSAVSFASVGVVPETSVRTQGAGMIFPRASPGLPARACCVVPCSPAASANSPWDPGRRRS